MRIVETLPFSHSTKLNLRLGPLPSGTSMIVILIPVTSSKGSSNNTIVVSPSEVGSLLNSYIEYMKSLLVH